jgi:hypothetical protein
MSKKTTLSLGGGFLGYLTLIFITLKLIGTINWSWWLVLSPMLANIAIVMFLIVCIFILKFIAAK